MIREKKAKLYDKIIEKVNKMRHENCEACQMCIAELILELTESEDERIRKELITHCRNIRCVTEEGAEGVAKWISWLEKQGLEPNWCHHKVDLSNCSEEYRKAYYDGWNNCNMQHSQCKSESNDVVKCLINGMKFYYENNTEATWGTEKFSMKVKDILSWLEKQGESIKIKKGKNYLCTKTHKYAGVEWIKDTKYYASDNYTLVNRGCECYCPEYSKEEHNELFEEVKYDNYVEKQGEQKLPIDKLPSEMKSIEESLRFTTQEECDRYNEMVTDLIMSDDDKDEQKHADKVAPIEWSGKINSRNAKGVLKEMLDKKLKSEVEPKFKVGNIVKDPYGDVYHIIEINNNSYKTDEGRFILFENEDAYTLWTIQDAKDGDVLHSTGFHSDCVFIFNGLDNWKFDEPNGNRAVATGYCCITVSADNIEFDTQGPDCIEVNSIKPATQIQRDLLFQKMKEAGYEWDADKKELKKIEQKPNPYIGTSFVYNGHTYGMCARDNGVDILIDSKLKTHVSLDTNQNHAWSEEDENAIHVLKDIVRHSDEIDEKIYTMSLKEKLYEWLKSLRPQNKWKPSDEQIGVIEAVINNRSFQRRHLDSLYEQLKKLKLE